MDKGGRGVPRPHTGLDLQDTDVDLFVNVCQSVCTVVHGLFHSVCMCVHPSLLNHTTLRSHSYPVFNLPRH